MDEPVVGRRFGPYVVEGRVGEGGMGTVFRARDTRLGRTVALKVLRPDRKGEASEVARLLREARLAASLQHPGIVVIFEVGEVEGNAYIAMECLEGVSLARLQAHRLSLAHRMDLLSQIADAMAHAHVRGVVHRDLKPGNIVVSPEGIPKIVDFGIARRFAPTSEPHPLSFVTEDNVVLGTRLYMAPEQMIMSAVDARADQFAWAVMAYELLAGVHPRHRTTGGTFPIARPLPLASVCKEIPKARAVVVDRALAVQAADRFASMDALLHAWRYDEAQTNEDTRALNATTVTSGPVLITPVGPRTVSQRPALVVLAIAAAVLAAGGAFPLGAAIKARRAKTSLGVDLSPGTNVTADAAVRSADATGDPDASAPPSATPATAEQPASSVVAAATAWQAPAATMTIKPRDPTPVRTTPAAPPTATKKFNPLAP